MQPLLLLHGAIGSKEQLKDLANKLSKDYEVYTFNFSGHGGKAFPTEPFSISLFAKEVLAFMNQKNLGSVSVFGYSMGGYVAMYLAKYHSEKINKVITLATKFYWDDAVAAKEIKMIEPAVLEQKVPAFAKQLQERHAPGDWKELLQLTQELLIKLGRNNTLSINDYTTIKNPCLLLLGDKDKMITLEETVAVYKQLPNAQFEVLTNTPHPIEQVDVNMLALNCLKFLLH